MVSHGIGYKRIEIAITNVFINVVYCLKNITQSLRVFFTFSHKSEFCPVPHCSLQKVSKSHR